MKETYTTRRTTRTPALPRIWAHGARARHPKQSAETRAVDPRRMLSSSKVNGTPDSQLFFYTHTLTHSFSKLTQKNSPSPILKLHEMSVAVVHAQEKTFENTSTAPTYTPQRKLNTPLSIHPFLHHSTCPPGPPEPDSCDLRLRCSAFSNTLCRFLSRSASIFFRSLPWFCS